MPKIKVIIVGNRDPTIEGNANLYISMEGAEVVRIRSGIPPRERLGGISPQTYIIFLGHAKVDSVNGIAPAKFCASGDFDTDGLTGEQLADLAIKEGLSHEAHIFFDACQAAEDTAQNESLIKTFLKTLAKKGYSEVTVTGLPCPAGYFDGRASVCLLSHNSADIGKGSFRAFPATLDNRVRLARIKELEEVASPLIDAIHSYSQKSYKLFDSTDKEHFWSSYLKANPKLVSLMTKNGIIAPYANLNKQLEQLNSKIQSEIKGHTDQIESTKLVLATTDTPFGLFNKMGLTYSAKYNESTGEYDIQESIFVAQHVEGAVAQYREQLSALKSADRSTVLKAQPMSARVVMPNRIQPQDQIGPNNAGKTILQGCFMNISEDWIRHTSGEVGELLTLYLHNRRNEATAISLNYRDTIPTGREEGPHRLDLEFMEEVTHALVKLEIKGAKLHHAKADDIFDQVTEQVALLNTAILSYVKKCEEAHIDPMFTGVPSIIIQNVIDRTPVTHAKSMLWKVREEKPAAVVVHIAPVAPSSASNLFEGLEMRGRHAQAPVTQAPVAPTPESNLFKGLEMRGRHAQAPVAPAPVVPTPESNLFEGLEIRGPK